MEPKHFSWDDLLKPTQFDWADDVEEELEGGAEIEREPELVEEIEDLIMEDTPQTEKPECRGPLIVNSAVNTATDNETWEQETDSCSSTEYDGEIESMQFAVNGEFAYRRACLQADNERVIHHFNWLGAPVYGHNPTPPTISLFFLLTDPKIPPSGHEWRYESILKRAMVFVDPVILCVDNGNEDLCRRGFDLVRWATGRVYKFYSPHGKWVKDARDLEEFPVLDDGNLVTYASHSTISGNGFIEQFSIRSRSQWAQSRDECYYMAHRHQKSRRKGFGTSSSPLRQSMTPSDLDVDVEDDHVEEVIIERPPSRLSHKRSSNESPRSSVRGLKRRASIHNFKVELASLDEEESSKIGCFQVDDFVRLSGEEKELAEDIKSRKLLKKSYQPVFATVGEEDESPEHTDGQDQEQPQRSRYVSTGTQTELSGFVVGYSLTDVKPVAEEVGQRREKKQLLAYLSQKKENVKKGLRRFTNRTRDSFRAEKSPFTLAPESATTSQSSGFSTSPSTTAPGKETGSSTSSSVVVASQADSGFAEKQASSTSKPRHSLEEHGEALSLKKRLAATMKNIRRSASDIELPMPAGKKSVLSEFCGNFLYDGIWALEKHPVYPLIL